MTTDNLITSLPITEKRFTEYSLTMIGTIRKNKREIPGAFKTSHIAGTTLLPYTANKILILYSPKANKIVLILSTLNQSPAIDGVTQKPVAVLNYNGKKGGTDMLDYFCHRYKVTRKTPDGL